jgi:CHAT domain-containing protein
MSFLNYRCAESYRLNSALESRVRGRVRCYLTRSFMVLLTVFLAIPVLSSSKGRKTFQPKPAKAAKAAAPILVEISGGTSQTFPVTLASGEYFRVSIDKGDSLVSLAIDGPSGQRIIETSDHRYASLEASLIAEAAGAYQVAVRSLETDPVARRYELRFEHAGIARAQDLADTRASRAFADGDRLSVEWSEASLRRAADKFTEAALTWRSVRAVRAIDAFRRAADVQLILGESAKSLDLNRKAAAESVRRGDQLRKFEAEVALAQNYSFLGKNETAQKYLERVLRYCRQKSDMEKSPAEKLLAAAANNARGEVYYAVGNPVTSLDHFKQAFELWTSVGYRRGQAEAQLNIGYSFSNSGNQTEALTQFNRAIDLYRLIGDRRGEALCLTALGSLSSLQGKEQAALDSHLKALEFFRATGDLQQQGVALNGAGQAFEDLGEKQTALDNYERALELFRRIENFDFATVTEYKIASSYRKSGDTESALLHYQQCLLLGRSAGKTRLQAYALKDIAEIYQAQGKERETFSQYQKVLRLYRTAGDLRGQAMILRSIGGLFLAGGENNKALSFYKQALPLIRTAGDRDGEISTLIEIGRAARAANLLDEALSYVEQSIERIEALRSFVVSPDLRSSYFTSVHEHYELCIQLLMQLDPQRPGRGYAARALRVSESARARALAETLAEAGADIRQGMDPRKIEREQALQQMLAAKERYQLQLASNRELQPEAAQVAREIRQLITEEQVLQGEMRAENPRYAAIVQPQPLSLEEIQAELRGEDTIVLEYSLGDKQSFLWAVTEDSFSGYELPPRATIEAAAHDVYDLLTARQRLGDEKYYQQRVIQADAEFPVKALALSNLLLGPVAAKLGKRRLLIITDGLLQYIPFEALPVPQLSANQTSDQAVGEPDPLVSDHEVVSLPSISVLSVLRRDRTTSNAKQKVVAVFADPVFGANDKRLARSAGTPGETDKAPAPELALALRGFDDFVEGQAIPRLPHTETEANGILNLVPSDQSLSATGFSANRSTMLSPQIGEYQIVHFATHGLINSAQPRLSGIILSMVDKNGSVENGFIRLSDIYNLKLDARLVVLSACSTGLGKDVKGEGLVGLTRGFMHAGARSVVASLWKVDDRATSELMNRFYAAMLVEKLPPAAALRVAKEALRKEKRWQAPYYWAGFVLQGEYRERVNMEATHSRSAYIVFSLAVLLVCLTSGFYLIRRRRKTSFVS